MGLSPGSKVGPYEVTAPLGAGGMGEVFRARDARLRRDVALKVLSAAAVGDQDRRGRFEREAQVLASLNHASIAQVFGVESDGDALVIVMELVEGETLADRLARGPLPIDEALAVAVQLCDGLEAAHESGIIHRDLKPANIKMRPDGTIKILDFGLARVLTADARADTANSPTMIGAHTDSGIILGTAAYMSPEQARGRAVDKRADIWAFGCVVFEMLTGTRVFAGDSTADLLAEVINREPDWSRLPPAVPEKVRALLRRCLEKNPKDRLRDIGDARYEIEHAHDVTTTLVTPVNGAGAWKTPLIWFAAGAAIAAALLIVTSVLRTSAPASAAPVRAVITLPPETTVALSRGAAVTVSPDGKSIVYAGKSHGKISLYLRSFDRFESQLLPGTNDAASPFFSPDGRWVGFFAEGKLKKVAIDGGTPVVVADVPNARGETWADGDQIFVTPANNMAVSGVPATGGALKAVTTLHEGELSHRWPRALPDGKSLVYTVWNDTGWDLGRIAVQRLDGSQPKLVVESGGSYGVYVRDAGHHGYLVYARSEGLLAAPFDESQLALTGPSVPVVDSVIANLSGGAHFDLSPSGTLAYVPGSSSESDRALSWVTLDGKASPPMPFRGLAFYWRLSPDGTKVIHNSSTNDVVIEDLTRGGTQRLMGPAGAVDYSGVLSADGKWLAFARGVPTGNLYRRPSDGRGTEERLTTSPRHQSQPNFSPDGRLLAYAEIDPVSGSDIWILTLPADGKPASARPFVQTKAFEGYAAFSPDGRWVAYESNESGRFEVYIRSFPDGQQVISVSTDGGIIPQWSASGREVYFRSLSGKMMAVPIGSTSAIKIGAPRVMFDAQGYETGFNVSPDGQRLLLMPLDPSVYSATQINVVFNFLTELRQRVR